MSRLKRAWLGTAGIALSWIAGSSNAGAQEPTSSARAPDDVAAVIARAAEEMANGRAAEAEDLLRNALRNEREPPLLLELGAVLIERASALDATSDLGQSLRVGVLEEALEAYVEAAKSEDSMVDGVVGAAACHVLLGRPAQAEAALRAALGALRERGAPPAIRLQLVRELVFRLATMNENGEANGKGDEAARAAIAEAQSLGELDDAGVRLEELRIAAARVDPVRTPGLALAAIEAGADAYETAYLCWDAMGEGHLEVLLHVYSTLLERRPGDLALLYYRGATRLFLRDGEGAIGDLSPCLEDRRFSRRARLYLGRALLRVQRAEESLQHFERLLADGGELAADALNGVIGVAVLRAQARQFGPALELYQRVLARDPYNLWGRIGEPLCWRSLGEFTKAAASYEAGLELLPDEPQLLNDYALLLKARGERAKAKELFERALGAGSADAGENLGIVAYRDEHDRSAAARYFARTLLLDANRARVRFYRELCLCDASQ